MIFAISIDHGGHDHQLSGACNVFSERRNEEVLPVIELIALEVVIDHGERTREINPARLSDENRKLVEEAVIKEMENERNVT